MWHSTGVADAAESQGSGVTWKGCHLPRVASSPQAVSLAPSGSLQNCKHGSQDWVVVTRCVKGQGWHQ